MGGRAVIKLLMLSMRYSIISFFREKSLFFKIEKNDVFLSLPL
jgi:hypothetical protein